MSDRLSVTIAVLTFRRDEELRKALPLLVSQLATLDDAILGDVLVVDNDPAGPARQVVEALNDTRVRYVVESHPGIASARNRALDECIDHDVLVFIDDDECPTEGWLAKMLATHAEFGAAAVAGPVRSEFAGEVDPWIAAGAFFGRRHRLHLSTGSQIPTAATNNLLLDLRRVRELGLRFPVEVKLAGGEDNLFTQSLTRAGGLLVWCADALVTEIVPVDRGTRRWVLLRSLSSGNVLSRVALRTSPPGLPAVLLRIKLLIGGLVRIVGGSARWLAGCLGRALTHRARGMRTVARGIGMVLGASGYSYQAYRRKGDGDDTLGTRTGT